MRQLNEKKIWFSNLPEDWSFRRIKAIVSSNDGGVWGDDCHDQEGVGVLRSNEITQDGKWAIADPAIRLLSAHEAESRRLVKDDILLVKSSGSKEHIGKTAIVDTTVEKGNFCFSNFTQRLRPISHLLFGKFLWYILNNSPGRDELFYYGTTTTGLINLSGSNLGRVIVPLPPLLEQKRIVAYLDASCAAIDRAVETKQKQLDTLDALRKSIITPAVLSGITPNKQFQNIDNPWLNQIPEGWKLVSLKRVSEIQSGITLGKIYDGSLVERPYLRAANVQDGYLDLDKITTIELPENLISRYELQAGDVLMTEGGDLDKLGRGFLWEGQIEGCLHQNHVFAIRTVPRLLLPEFLTYLTTSRFGRDYFEATGKRTTNLASTNSTKVGLLPVPLPRIDEQREIVDHLDRQLKQTKAIEETIASQIATIMAYRKSLIHECVTGKRRISDADVAKVEAYV
jgi:type I restriction enzyme S subunit